MWDVLVGIAWLGGSEVISMGHTQCRDALRCLITSYSLII